jgi:hypothetical protein
MAVARSSVSLKELGILYAEGSIGGLTDGQLLERVGWGGGGGGEGGEGGGV